MNATTTKLQFHRIEAGRYQADSETRRYVVARWNKGWLVVAYVLTETAGIKHTLGQPIEAETSGVLTKALAVDIARRYDQLIAEGYGRLFTDLKPMTKAVIDAYDAEAV
jgi:hypothetical protein